MSRSRGFRSGRKRDLIRPLKIWSNSSDVHVPFSLVPRIASHVEPKSDLGSYWCNGLAECDRSSLENSLLESCSVSLMFITVCVTRTGSPAGNLLRPKCRFQCATGSLSPFCPPIRPRRASACRSWPGPERAGALKSSAGASQSTRQHPPQAASASAVTGVVAAVSRFHALIRWWWA